MVPKLSVFPEDDLPYLVEASRVVASVTDAMGVSERALDAATTALRRQYPNTVIRRREAIASFGELDVLWYVFRDGRLRPPDWRRERHYRALALARRTVADAQRVLLRSADIARRAGYVPGGSERHVESAASPCDRAAQPPPSEVVG